MVKLLLAENKIGEPVIKLGGKPTTIPASLKDKVYSLLEVDKAKLTKIKRGQIVHLDISREAAIKLAKLTTGLAKLLGETE